MTIIKKIINWLKKLFLKFFGKKSKVNKKITKNIKKMNNKRYLKGYGVFVEESDNIVLPIYLLITKEEKEKIKDKITLITKKMEQIDIECKEETINKIINIAKKIEKQEIAFYQVNIINDVLNDIVNDIIVIDKDEKKVPEKLNDKVATLDEIVSNTMIKYDKMLKQKVVSEYKKVNYVTLTTVVVDEIQKEIINLKEDFKLHKYNKYYYERKINQLKNKIDGLLEMRNNKSIDEEIISLRKEMYTKSKDKYDLLYNDEIFLGLKKDCDDFLKKVNRKVIDIKKIKKVEEQDVKEEKKEDNEKKKKEKELLEKILLRFEDVELARRLLLMNKEKLLLISNKEEIISLVDKIYLEFLNGEKVKFNFDRNKTKTELVKLFNGLRYCRALFTDEEIVSLDHINVKMDSLLYSVMDEKRKVDDILKNNFNYNKEKQEDNILVENKLNILLENELEKEKGKVLIKKSDSLK